MLLGVLKLIILQFVITEGQMVPNPYVPEKNHPAFSPNASSGMESNRYPSSKNSELDNYSGYDTSKDTGYPVEIPSNRNYPGNTNGNHVDYNSIKNIPAAYNSNNNKHFHYDSNNNYPAHYNSNNGGPANYNSYYNNPTDYGKKFYKRAVGLKRFNPHLKVMLSLGGWTDSLKKYSDLVASTKKVNNFITKAVEFLKKHKFDGLDVAWEYPNCWQGAPNVNPKDKPNYARFLQKLRKAFDSENLLLSISVSAVQREIKLAYDGPKIAKAVHYINVMTYDMHGPWEKRTGHHTQFNKLSNDKDPTLNSKAAMDFWASTGVPKIKLNMGIATYATTFTLKNPTKHGFGAPTKGPGKAGDLSHNGGTLYYREICQYVQGGNWTEVEDQDVGFYAYSGDQWAGYDHPKMVVRKTRWIVDNGYGGLLIKDVSGDDYEKKCFSKRFPLIWIAGMEFTLAMKEKE